MPEAPGPVVYKEQRPPTGEHDQVLETDVPQVEEQCLGRLVQHADTGFVRLVDPTSILLPTVQAVGQPARLTHVEFVPAIAIDVAHRQPLIAVDSNPSCRVQP